MNAAHRFAGRYGLPATVQALRDIAHVLAKLEAPKAVAPLPAHRPPGTTEAVLGFERVVELIDAQMAAEGRTRLSAQKLAGQLLLVPVLVDSAPIITHALDQEALRQRIVRARRKTRSG